MEKQEAGRISYEKRKRTLEKKAQDLSTLCGISVCTVCFDPSGNVDTWPKDPHAVRAILGSYAARRDANKIWELTEAAAPPAPHQNHHQNQILDKDNRTNKKKKREETNQDQNHEKDHQKKKEEEEDDLQEEQTNQNQILENDNKNDKKKKDEQEEENNVTVVSHNKQQVREGNVEKQPMLKRWEAWESRLEEKEDLTQESLMAIAEALDYKLQIVNGMIGLKEMAQRRKLGIRIRDSASTSNSSSNGKVAQCQNQNKKLKGICHGICSSSSGTTPVGDGSSSSHDNNNNNDSDIVGSDQNRDLYRQVAASRPPHLFQFF